METLNNRFVYYGNDILLTDEKNRVIGVVKMFDQDLIAHQTRRKAHTDVFSRQNEEESTRESWRAVEKRRGLRVYEGR